MVWSRHTEEERPPVSVILPHLYLGAEADVTQERLTSLCISYVLTVSRCSPQPSFLPQSRFLRVPVDDSLRDDLLPWIPQAVHFIDAAVSRGASVLVHCAAGVSRSPALAVAYVMYSLQMDLDQAYRFVKERRPSISPNFNFLGQLQHFQGTLRHSASAGHPVLQQLDTHVPNSTLSTPRVDSVDHSRADTVTEQTQTVNTQHTDENRNQRPSLSEKLCGLNQPQEDQTLCEPVKPAPQTTGLQLPSGSASLVEKRKSLTLSLTCPLVSSSSRRTSEDTSRAKTSHRKEPGGQPRPEKHQNPVEETHHHGWTSSLNPCSRAVVQQQGALSSFSCTLNKLLDWGDRVLLGGLFLPPVRMGQAALPYRC